jgi:hypothetical protein
MNPIMNINDLNTKEQLEQFLTGSQSVAFLVASSKDQCYPGIQRTLVKFRYPSLNKRSKGVVVRFLVKITAYSRQQRTHQSFDRLYATTDIRLLASLDERHNILSGPAAKNICERVNSLFNGD